jgi:hypothetical protein
MGGVCCRPTVCIPLYPLARALIVSSRSTLMERSPYFISCSSVVWAKAHSARHVASLVSCLLPADKDTPGPRRSAQTDPRVVRSQIHQQGKMRKNEGRSKCHPGAAAARRGQHPPPPNSPTHGSISLSRSTIPLSSIYATLSRMMRTASLSWISCSAATCAVRCTMSHRASCSIT